MSRRRSTGDLVPWDVTEIVGREVKAQRSHRKPGSSLGQAISWLRSSQKKKKKAKKSVDNGGRQQAVADVLQNHDAAKGAGSKANDEQKKLTVHFSATQHFQENVFIEGDRSQYLEDLHSEALEGLKILQQKGQQEHESGVTFTEDESLSASSDTAHQDNLSHKDEGGSLESKSNSGITDMRTSVLTKPVLTRQGSTFRPLHPVKRLEKCRKRTRRTTIMGIPNQVQKELGFHSGSTFQQTVSTQLPNHNSQTGVFIIPTVEGGTPMMAKEGARVHLSELEVCGDNQQMKSHPKQVYKDEEPLNHQGFGTHHYRSSVIRPKSVAVPGMTTFTSFNPLMNNLLVESQGPVMSVSPQATYLSTIIPNAVLPASVEVIEIDCGCQRGNSVNHSGSVHTVSKSSLASAGSSASPFLSRKLDNDGSQTESSIKHSATDGTTHKVDFNLQESCVDSRSGQELTSLHNSENLSSHTEKSTTNKPSELAIPCARGDNAKIKRNSTRSLSIIKTKLPPAPPRRSNSLYNNKIQPNSKGQLDENANCSASQVTIKANAPASEELEQVTAEGNKILDPTLTFTKSISHASSSPIGSTQASSGETRSTAAESVSEINTSLPKKTSSEGETFERTISPSSGYSSQSGTPTLSAKEITPTSPDKQKMKPVKPERSVSRASSSASPSSSLTSLSSGTSEPVNTDVSSSCTTSLPPVSVKEFSSSLGMDARELWNVPPPPKVKAPCPPPPETWAQNSHTFALLCAPSPQVSKVLMESTKTTQCAVTPVKPEESQTETGEFNNDEKTKEKTEASEIKSKAEQLLCAIPGNDHQDQQSLECPNAQENTVLPKDRIEETVEVQGKATCIITMNDSSNCNITIKKEPPPVMKKPLLKEDRRLPERQQTESCNITNEETTTSIDESEDKINTTENPSIPVNSVEPLIINKTSPPPSPPPAYQPTPPLTRKSPPTSVSTSAVESEEVQEESRTAESSWPPPPPPLEGDSVFDGGDELEFPLPPPPVVTENIPAVDDTCSKQMDGSETQIPPLEEFVKTKLVSSDAETSIPSDPVLPRTDVCDKKYTETSQGHIDTISPVLDNPPSSLISPSDMQPSVSAITSYSSFLKRRSLEIQSHSTTEPTITSQPLTLVTSSLPMENITAGVAFRRPPNTAHRDNRGKELLARHKSAPIPKEDANIPLVTPSLLHMVRLRTVNTPEDGVDAPSEGKSTNEGASVQDISGAPIVGQQKTPPKPTRKALKSPPPVGKTYMAPNTPSMRLQEAIRIKTAALSSRDSLPCRRGLRPSYHYANEPGVLSLKSSEAYDTQRLPASTASFIFSRRTKQVVNETGAASSPEVQANVKQGLAAELMQFSDQTSTAAYLSSGLRSDRVPPPVARKPLQGSISLSQDHPTCPARTEPGVPTGDATGAQQNSKGIALPETTTRVTADTIETLF
ncbi:uncharacterized protein KIAA1522 homolog isoform X2 [Corythoichthys intestinalis]|uniref:uncharacterized protein KIAA1522 homolog isoform X2 n=1 Tax=Corythoichthys intestinalis TaxID=161448 RepID=UPI0025A5EB09|nr:uncharacterized protein KIAA1522 homolog isoform X2 [Corythoichthys intestinalis]